MSQSRHRVLVRVLKLVRHLEGRRYIQSLGTLAGLFGVHERTIRRDLEALERAGWKLPHWRHLIQPKGDSC